MEPVSLQTVGRRVDALHDEGYLENTIVSPQNVPRDLIIGYILTDNGEQAVEAKRHELLRETVRDELFGDTDHPEIDRDVLAELLSAEMDDRYAATADQSREALLILTGTYLLQSAATTVFDETELQNISDAISQQEKPVTLLP
jgi:hypothetical protein